jgi:hypothetical protein
LFDLQKIDAFCAAVERQGEVYPREDRNRQIHQDVQDVLDEAPKYDAANFEFLRDWRQLPHHALRDALRQFHQKSVSGGAGAGSGGVSRELRPALMNLKLAWSGLGMQEVTTWLLGLRKCVEAHKAEWLKMSKESRQMLIKDFAVACVKPSFSGTLEAARHPQKEVWLHINLLLEHKLISFLIPRERTNESAVASSRTIPNHLSGIGEGNMHHQDLYGLIMSMCRRAHDLIEESKVRQEPTFTRIKGETFVYGEGVFMKELPEVAPPSQKSGSSKRPRERSPTSALPSKQKHSQSHQGGTTGSSDWADMVRLDAEDSDREANRPGDRCFACGRKHLKACTYDHHPRKNTDPSKQWADTPQAGEYARLVGRQRKTILPRFDLDKKYVPLPWRPPPSGHTGGNPPRGNPNKSHGKGHKRDSTTGNRAGSGKYVLNLRTSRSLNSYNFPCEIVYRNRTLQVEAVLDSGAHRASYVNSNVLSWLNAVRAEVTSHRSCTVCSGLTGMCAPCLGRVDLIIRVTCDNGLPYEFSAKCVIIDAPFDLFIGLDDIRKHDLTLRVRSYFTNKDENSSESDSRSVEMGRTSSVAEQDSSAIVLSRTRRRLRRTDFVTERVIPAERLVGTQYEDTLPLSIATLYTKEELLDLLPEDMEPEEDPFFRDPDHPDRNPAGSELLPATDGTPALPVIEGDTPFHDELRALVSDYRDVFSTELSKTPANIPPMQLKIDESRWYTSQNRSPPRPQSPVKRQAIRDMIEEMLRAGVIAPSQASAYSQVLLVPKPNGSWRFCVDYRSLNEISDTMGWPIPNIKRMLWSIGQQGSKYFAVLDFTSGYYQVLLDEVTRKYAAFITDFGVFEPVRISMGLRNAPSYFQQQVATLVLAGLIHIICELYIDDVIAHAKTEAQFIANLTNIFERFRSYGIKVNPAKAKIGLLQLDFVGRVLSEKWMGMSVRNIEKVTNFPRPSTELQLKRFLGLTNYFADHIRSYQMIVQPLHEMVRHYETSRKNRKVFWTEEAVQAYHAVKEAITNCPHLYFPQDDAELTVLETDASDKGIGAIILQIVKGIRYPLAFLSKTLNKVQQRWSTIEKECYAIWFALRQWEFLLRDTFFIIRTDHRNLKYLNTNTPKVVRWKLSVQEYNFQVEDIKGPTNVAADALSRLCVEEEEAAQPAISQARAAATSSTEPLTLNALSLPSARNFKRLRIPLEYRILIAQVHNDCEGHHGVEMTLMKLNKKNMTWRKRRMHVKAFVAQCPVCQKLAPIKIAVVTQPFTVGTYNPFERLSVDSIGPLPETEEGYVYILVAVDNFTRFVQLYSTKTVEGKEAAERLLWYCATFGTPSQIFSDNGTQFVNELVTSLCDLLHCDKIEGFPYSHEENAIVERANKEVIRHLRAFMHSERIKANWLHSLPLVQRILNATVHSSIGVSPAQLVFGNSVTLERQLVSDVALKQMVGEEKANELVATKASVAITPSNYREYMDKMLSMQSTLLQIAQQLQEERDDRHHKKQQTGAVTEFPIGSYVKVRPNQSAFGHKGPTKLHTPWQGPYRVVNHVGSVYTLQDLVTLQNRDVHVTNIQEYIAVEGGEDPATVALADREFFIVESVLAHKGRPELRSSMQFQIKWQGDETPTWEPYKNLRDNALVHLYCWQQEKLRKLVPPRYLDESKKRLLTEHELQQQVDKQNAQQHKRLRN